MTKFMITGLSGFVSRHFLNYLDSINVEAEILGVDIFKPEYSLSNYKHLKLTFKQVNLLNGKDIIKILRMFKPEYILHLASSSSVAYSWKQPVKSFQNNTNIFLNLIKAVYDLGLFCRILSIGSSEEYGNISTEDLPLKEDHRLNPLSPYAVARVSQEMLSRIYSEGYGLNIVMTRSFNHIGPYQKDLFAVASFADQLLKLKKKGLNEGDIIVGDVDVIRDLIDVRDVVVAYYELLKRGKKGEIYNVCSGKGVALRTVIDILAYLLNIKVNVIINSDLLRPNDNKIITGSNEKITRELGWEIKYTLEQSLRDILASLLRPNDNKIIIGSNEKITRELGWEIKYTLEQSLQDILASSSSGRS